MTTPRETVCIQGLGFVGAAMATAVACARHDDGTRRFDVVGVDLPTSSGLERIAAINSGRFPFTTADCKLVDAVKRAHEDGNLQATADPCVYGDADVIVVDVNLDVVSGASGPALDTGPLRAASRTIGARMKPGALVIVETTVPPGATSRIVACEIETELARRGLRRDAYLLAHSYERVMPGADYLDSIVNYWRVFAGHTPAAADAAERFLSAVINTRDFPLTKLASTTASETAKLLENSYRAVNIALIDEWSRFAEAVDIDLFEVVDAIRIRPTHSNIRYPGFGVGGYCLTKDPLIAQLAARELWDVSLDFPFCRGAIATNDAMPLATLRRIEDYFGGLEARRLLLLGVSYRQEVADTRRSPAETFYTEAVRKGAAVACHDPVVRHWPEVGRDIPNHLPDADQFDAVVFAVPHREYRELDLAGWLGSARPLVVDANRVLTERQRAAATAAGCRFLATGRGQQ